METAELLMMKHNNLLEERADLLRKLLEFKQKLKTDISLLQNIISEETKDNGCDDDDDE